MDRFAVIGPLQRETARFLAVISLFRVLKNRGILPPSAICPLFFRGKNSENSGARLAALRASSHSSPATRGG